MTRQTLAASEVKARLTSGREIAFLDVREHGQYGEGHPLLAVSLPYSVLEWRARVLLPSRTVPIVLLDSDDGVAERAAEALERIGYTDISLLDGGANSWRAAGYTLFKGVNVPSKVFGELVEHSRGTPSVSAQELLSMREAGPVAVLDGRTPGEFRKMSLPGACSCPNAELAHRLSALVPDPSTPVVVNCAGRTRSIIGAESLRSAGVPNPVYALRNGTQGWRLAGLDLEHGSEPAALPAQDDAGRILSERRAADLIAQQRLPVVDSDTVTNWRAEEARTTYLLDVRTREEFEAGHLSGFRSAPGGQLVQATDEHVAVRGARIVLACDTKLRAAMSAMWLRSMGHDAHILDCDASLGRETGPAVSPDVPGSTILPHQIAERVNGGATLLDASRSMDYRKGHIGGARWVTRARLGGVPDGDVVVAGSDPGLVAGVCIDLVRIGGARVDSIVGSMTDWRELGLPIESSPSHPPDAECIDYLFFVHDRHDGNLAAARAYLEWETGLVAQLDEAERALFQVPELP